MIDRQLRYITLSSQALGTGETWLTWSINFTGAYDKHEPAEHGQNRLVRTQEKALTHIQGRYGVPLHNISTDFE